MRDARSVHELLPVPEALRPYLAAETTDPRNDHTSNSPWLDEQMWGHRLFDSQSPWLVFLEFLSVAEGLSTDGKVLTDDAPYPLNFKPAQRMYLRNIMFASDEAMRLAEAEPESRRWEAFIGHLNKHALGFPIAVGFEHLRQHFPTFNDFSRVLALLRASTVERGSNKRWSSRFLFPFGAHAIYEDLNVKPTGGSPAREYINFGRTGELLYLMLARSSHRAELKPMVEAMVAAGGRWDRLVSKLEPTEENVGRREWRGQSYLPYAGHPIFDTLAEDWLAIRATKLPAYDTYPHLVTVAGLHLVRYFLAVARAWAGTGDGVTSPFMTCEIITPRKTLVRELSLRSYGTNDAYSASAIERTVERIGTTSAWQTLAAAGYGECQGYLKDVLNWGGGNAYNGPNDPVELLAALKSDAQRRHQQHLGQFHRTIGRDIGLVSRRGTNRFRYAPTDDLVRTLLIATVGQRMEFGEFLHVLFERYGLVIGPREAQAAYRGEDIDQKAFRANAVRLEERLASLGLVRRLSDACAYVLNPYQRVAQREHQ